MAWRGGWGLIVALLLTTGCAELSLDAPPPRAAEAAAEAKTAQATGGAAGETPVWLQELNDQSGTAVPGGPVQPGLGADPAASGYSGEALTHQSAAASGGGDKTWSEKLLAQERATGAAAPGAALATAAADPVSLQSAALPIVRGFRIQLATLPNTAAALTVWRELQTNHPKILGSKQIILIDLNLGYRGIFHRLEAGPFETLTAAWEACIALVRRRQGCVVSQP